MTFVLLVNGLGRNSGGEYSQFAWFWAGHDYCGDLHGIFLSRLI